MRIGSLNIGTLVPRLRQVVDQMKSAKIDILCLQDILMTKNALVAVQRKLRRWGLKGYVDQFHKKKLGKPRGR